MLRRSKKERRELWSEKKLAIHVEERKPGEISQSLEVQPSEKPRGERRGVWEWFFGGGFFSFSRTGDPRKPGTADPKEVALST